MPFVSLCLAAGNLLARSAGTEVELVFERNSKLIVVKVLRSSSARVSGDLVDVCKLKTDRLPADDLSMSIVEARSGTFQCSGVQSICDDFLKNESRKYESEGCGSPEQTIQLSSHKVSVCPEITDEMGNCSYVQGAPSCDKPCDSGAVNAAESHDEIFTAELVVGKSDHQYPLAGFSLTPAHLHNTNNSVETENARQQTISITATTVRPLLSRKQVEGVSPDGRVKRLSRWGPLNNDSRLKIESFPDVELLPIEKEANRVLNESNRVHCSGSKGEEQSVILQQKLKTCEVSCVESGIPGNTDGCEITSTKEVQLSECQESARSQNSPSMAHSTQRSASTIEKIPASAESLDSFSGSKNGNEVLRDGVSQVIFFLKACSISGYPFLLACWWS